MSRPQYWAIGTIGGTPRITRRRHYTPRQAARALLGREASLWGWWAKPLGQDPQAVDVPAIDGWAPVLEVRY
jgi:hypothetical protein